MGSWGCPSIPTVVGGPDGARTGSLGRGGLNRFKL
jgi:hypothetical protein